MVYVDTNVLIYAGVEQDLNKKMVAMRLLENHAQNNTLHVWSLRNTGHIPH